MLTLINQIHNNSIFAFKCYIMKAVYPCKGKYTIHVNLINAHKTHFKCNRSNVCVIWEYLNVNKEIWVFKFEIIILSDIYHMWQLEDSVYDKW